MIDTRVLDILCPMHLCLDAQGLVTQAGGTVKKIHPAPLAGRAFFDLFEIYRPRGVTAVADLLSHDGRKLHLRFRDLAQPALKAVVVQDGSGGAVVNLSFGIGVIDAVHAFDLTSRDFASTDPTIEMLYLVEANSAAMEASRNLNTRLKGAMIAAEQQAFTDTLTGLRNRRALDHVLHRLERSAAPYVLLHLDLDYFKQVNDTFGHAAGDRVLQVVAHILAEQTRKDDTVARVGGDEFVIVLSGCVDDARILSLSRAVIDRIEAPILYAGHACKVSASIGAARSEPGLSPTQVMAHADDALYAAKNAGRSRARLFAPSKDAGHASQDRRVAERRGSA